MGARVERHPAFNLYLPGPALCRGTDSAALMPGNATRLVRHLTYVLPPSTPRSGAASACESTRRCRRRSSLARNSRRVPRQRSPARACGSRTRCAVAPRSAQPQGNDRDGISFAHELIGVGAATAASSLVGGLDGKRIAIEGFGAAGLGIAREAAAAGATITRVATAKGCTGDRIGGGELDPMALTEAWLADGDMCVATLSGDGEPAKPWTVWKDDVDVLFCGSKPGAMSGDGAAMAGATPIVAFSAAAVSSKALAVLRAAGTAVAADFIATAGPALGWWADETLTHDDLRSATADTVNAVMSETADHDDGAFMAACYRAEAFLRTWQDELPFGRPLG